MGGKVLAAVLTTVATTLAKRVVERAWKKTIANPARAGAAAR
jgi:hypothetical protein